MSVAKPELIFGKGHKKIRWGEAIRGGHCSITESKNLRRILEKKVKVQHPNPPLVAPLDTKS